MGGQLFFSERDEKAKEKRRLLREQNGFVPGAHKEEDSIRNKNKKLPKTKRLHQEKLGLWLEYVEKNAGQIVADFFLASRQIPKMDIRITKPLRGVRLRAMTW
jgi:sorbitol-specific phosphotransferase system component IIBC